MVVYAELLEVTGAWIQTIGAAVASIGDTIIVREEINTRAEEAGVKLYTLGNGIEATGNSLQAVGRSKKRREDNGRDFAILGTWLQAGGNIANVVAGALVLKGEIQEALNLDLIGDVCQSTGASFEALGVSLNLSEFAPIIIAGEIVQAISVAVEAIGVIYIKQRKREMGEQIIALGSYGQTAGAALASIGITRNFLNKHG
ncbi:hypothetical protein ABFG93_00725 [Pseudalkalibacillus hwajinpoensis]|uniref:DUF6944 family repetitive protein n=1 Tax=Guptibacillus hwajinpoensis TaxID=208199 RepID=UPI00325B6E85